MVYCLFYHHIMSILKEISPRCSLEGLMLKLKLQYFGHLMQRVDSLERPWCWEGLEAGGEGGDRGWDGWMPSPTQWTWVWVNWELVMDREAWNTVVHGVAKCRTRLSNWTELNVLLVSWHFYFRSSVPLNLKWVCYIHHIVGYLFLFIYFLIS